MIKMRQTNRTALVEFLKWLRNKKVTWFDTQAKLYRAIEVIKFPHLAGTPRSAEDRDPSLWWPRYQNELYKNRHTNLYAPSNYYPIVNALTHKYNVSSNTYRLFEQTRTSGDRRIAYAMTKEAALAIIHSDQDRFDAMCNFALSNGPESDYFKDALHFAVNSGRHNRYEKIVSNLPVPQQNSNNEPPAKVQRVREEYHWLKLTHQEMQELYYLAGVGAMSGKFANQEIAQPLMAKLSEALHRK